MCAMFMQPEHEPVNCEACCAEMRCCTPEIVTATIGGFSGVLIPQYCVIASNGASPLQNKPPSLPPASLPAYTNPGPFTGVYSRLLDSGGASGGKCCEGIGIGCLSPHAPEPWHSGLPPSMPPDECQPVNICTSDVLWSSSAFPPKIVRYDFQESDIQCAGRYNPDYFPGFRTDVYWVTDTRIDCLAAPLFCQMPDTSATHYGPTPDESTQIICEEDYNGSVVLRRNAYGLRPELYAKVNRSKPAAAGAVDAVLRFDVFCRRDWRFDGICNQEIIFDIHCRTQQLERIPDTEPPGEWYCVDYFCGPRHLDKSFTQDPCKSNKCTAAEGFVWPHLIAVSDDGNESAKLTLELEPVSYADGWLGEPFDENAVPEKSQTPYQWKVASVGVKVAGSGYSVGDFFTVYFDPAWAVNIKGQPRGFAQRGQVIFPLPASDAECLFPIKWADKYGLLPYDEVRNQDGAVEYYWCDQRLRVSAVGEGGKITEVEVVPWYQTPQFKPGNCFDIITKQQDKTPTYILYHRNLCHPVSVAVGGSGYSVGDTITWYCNDPACTTGTPAKGVVTDVDENGAVLDWHINGSDICMYGYGNWGCSLDNMAVADRPDCSRHPYETTDYLDERGAYKFDGKNLCELNWIGKKPVRSAASNTIQQFNTSGFSGVGVQISKEPCRTTFSLTRYQYGNPVYAPDGFRPYRYSSGLWLSIDRGTNEGESRQDEMLLKFPPYPPSEAGGAEIALTIGSESQEFADPYQCKSLGGPVKTARVIAGGSGFAFKDKTHSQPILPLSLGELAAAEAEATIANGSVTLVEVTKVGYGYSEASPPTVTFSDPPDTKATATGVAIVGANGRVSSVTVIDAGNGYSQSSPPSVTFSEPTVNAVTATGTSYVDGNGRVTSVEVTTSGEGYRTSPTVTISPPDDGGSTATATATIASDGRVTGVTVTSEGSGYSSSSPPTVTFSDPPSEEVTATGTAVVGSNGRISSVTITEDGEGYSQASPPTVTFGEPSTGNETATGTAVVDSEGRVSSITLTKPGSGYEEEPTVTIAPPTSGGFGAKLKSFSFSTVSDFPGVDYSKGEPYAASAMRFAYFPVSGVVIDSENRGQGYKVGETFQIKPVGGGAYTEAWGGGGDDPESCPNGAWYEGSYSTGLHEDGRLSTPFFTNQTSVGGNKSRESFCILKVTSVNQTGGITGLEVVAGGMMFRSQYTTGVKHPEIFPQVSSDTGVGCTFTHTVNTNPSSDKFGEVTGVKIEDEGHYYANPPSGWMWTIGDISIGGASMMAWKIWDGQFYDPFHPEKSTHVLVGGSGGLPPQIRKTEACLIGECYHDLLNRTYTLCRTYQMAPGSEMKTVMEGKYLFEDYGVPYSIPEKNPVAPSWAMFRKKDAEPYADGTYGRDAYMVIEWGYTVALSASIPSTCPDQTNGRTGITYEYP